MLFDRILLLLALLHITRAEQPEAPAPIEAPLRRLPWGQLNFLHTTDTHGWHAGHLQEAQYAADWGDYISFAHHLRQRADNDGSDLLLVDTGDRVEGNGLYDASHPPGKYTFDVIKKQRFDIVTVGNHELYINTTSLREYDEVVPDFKDSYIASNVDIYLPKDGKTVPLAPRYRKFKTKNQGIRILAFGFLFDFMGNANNTVIQPVHETVEEQWFQDAIREDDIDLFVVAGHIPVRDSDEFDTIYKAIRNVKWDIPIVFFGGHTHIRDYRRWEKRAHGIESGRYMESLGFLSISGLGSPDKGVVAPQASPEYQRLYIDNNLYSLHSHSDTNRSTFDTELGRNVSKSIHDIRSRMKLNRTFGCAPHDYWLNRAPYPSEDSLLTWLEKQVLPDTFSNISVSSKRPSIVITNSGAMRFDIFEGPFTEDSTYLLSPFLSGFRKISGVPFGAASQVLDILNNEGQILLDDLHSVLNGRPGWGKRKLKQLIPPLPPVNQATLRRSQVEVGYTESLAQQRPLSNHKDHASLPGYTTSDDIGDEGDDTIHQPIQFYAIPNCIAANVGFSSADSNDSPPDSVDLVYNEFIQDWVLLALRYLGVNYGEENTGVALEGKSLTAVITEWVSENWKCEDGQR